MKNCFIFSFGMVLSVVILASDSDKLEQTALAAQNSSHAQPRVGQSEENRIPRLISFVPTCDYIPGLGIYTYSDGVIIEHVPGGRKIKYPGSNEWVFSN